MTPERVIELALIPHLVNGCVSDHSIARTVEIAAAVAVALRQNGLLRHGEPSLPRAIERRLREGNADMKQVKDAARAFDSEVTDKQIYNALSMLTRHGRARRTGYGSYQAVTE